MLRLRLAEGMSLSEYEAKFGAPFAADAQQKIREYAKHGFLKLENGRIALTEKGFYVSNHILSELL